MKNNYQLRMEAQMKQEQERTGNGEEKPESNLDQNPHVKRKKIKKPKPQKMNDRDSPEMLTSPISSSIRAEDGTIMNI